MKRVVVVGLLSVGLLRAPLTVVDLWNDFAAEAKVWVILRQMQESDPGTVNAGARKQWDEKVVPAFREVNLAVKNE